MFALPGMRPFHNFFKVRNKLNKKDNNKHDILEKLWSDNILGKKESNVRANTHKYTTKYSIF